MLVQKSTRRFRVDGADGGTAGLGAVSMTGAFGTLTFDDNGIDNLYSDAYKSTTFHMQQQLGAAFM